MKLLIEKSIINFKLAANYKLLNPKNEKCP